jgi:hypothetical protein
MSHGAAATSAQMVMSFRIFIPVPSIDGRTTGAVMETSVPWLKNHSPGRSHRIEIMLSQRLGSRYRSGRSLDWLKFKNPDARAVRREAEEEWGKARQ